MSSTSIRAKFANLYRTSFLSLAILIYAGCEISPEEHAHQTSELTATQSEVTCKPDIDYGGLEEITDSSYSTVAIPGLSGYNLLSKDKGTICRVDAFRQEVVIYNYESKEETRLSTPDAQYYSITANNGYILVCGSPHLYIIKDGNVSKFTNIYKILNAIIVQEKLYAITPSKNNGSIMQQYTLQLYAKGELLNINEFFGMVGDLQPSFEMFSANETDLYIMHKYSSKILRVDTKTETVDLFDLSFASTTSEDNNMRFTIARKEKINVRLCNTYIDTLLLDNNLLCLLIKGDGVDILAKYDMQNNNIIKMYDIPQHLDSPIILSADSEIKLGVMQ